MKEKVIVSMGSFNPPHKGHFEMFDEILKVHDKFHLFVRYNESVDLTSREVKEKWFERISGEYDNRMIIHFFSIEDIKGKDYNPHILATAVRYFESVLGEPIDEVWTGEDAAPLLEGMDKEFPNMKFIVTKRCGITSTAIRGDIAGHKDCMPDYVYEDLMRITRGE